MSTVTEAPLTNARFPSAPYLQASAAQVTYALGAAQAAFKEFRKLPAPARGEVLRDIADAFTAKKDALGGLVSLEMGKILTEGRGEVQEVIDLAAVAVGLSRTMAGSYLPSERAGHVLMEKPNPLGVVGVVTAFNFPVAVHGWNFCLSFVCGNATVWKPAPSTPLTAIATTKLIAAVLKKHNLPTALATLIAGDVETSKALCEDERIPLISFTGSETVGRLVAQAVAKRLGKCILELGGNNAVTILSDANLDLAIPGVVFAAVGTSGQRCTSSRRVYVHRDIADKFLQRLVGAYEQIASKGLIGSAVHDSKALAGPLHSPAAVAKHKETLQAIKRRGGKILFGESTSVHTLPDHLAGGYWVQPAIVLHSNASDEAFAEEVFCPILNVYIISSLDEAIELNNGVRQGLSSALFTNDHVSIGKWLSAEGSDTGIVNVNAGTSGAEVGAGFGGEYDEAKSGGLTTWGLAMTVNSYHALVTAGNKATGWGRECGGTAWHAYCSWSTSVVNYSRELPLAQGVKFHL
jgi:aldehyde dehydrogenase family 7 protein A1